MKILLLSCSTGEGHNHCALAVKEALDARGSSTPSSATTAMTPLSARTCSRWKHSRSYAGGSAAT